MTKRKRYFIVADYNKDDKLSAWGDIEEDKLYKVLQIIFDTEK